MADNVIASAGTADGATFATDQRVADSVHFPLTKLVWGPLDTFTLVDTGASGIPIQDGGNSITIDGSITNISGTISLPTGAATAAKQPALGTAGTASADVITVQGIASMTALKVDGSAVTQPVSAASLPLPTGASTAAKQPALGTAGSASADVITIQGIASMTAVKVDGSAVTQPVSGTVTANNAPTTSGGLSFSYFTSAASNNKTAVKASAGQLYFISIQSIHSAPVYLKIFNATSANVTAGTTACDYQFMCPANSTAANGAGVVFSFDPGIAMSNAITVMLTTGISTTDNTSTSANIAIVTIGYK